MFAEYEYESPEEEGPDNIDDDELDRLEYEMTHHPWVTRVGYVDEEP